MDSIIKTVVIWTMLLGIFFTRAQNQSGRLKGGRYNAHLFLTWVLMALHCMSPNTLFWAINNSSAISTYFHVPVGPVPAAINLVTWVLSLVFGLGSILLAFGLALRKEKIRVLFIRLIPVIAIVDFFEFFKGYLSGSPAFPTDFVVIGIIICLLVVGLIHGTLYSFYRKERTISLIFEPPKPERKNENKEDQKNEENNKTHSDNDDEQ